MEIHAVVRNMFHEAIILKQIFSKLLFCVIHQVSGRRLGKKFKNVCNCQNTELFLRSLRLIIIFDVVPSLYSTDIKS